MGFQKASSDCGKLPENATQKSALFSTLLMKSLATIISFILAPKNY
jgi:hypothetical protein